MKDNAITPRDVARLAVERSPAARADLAAKLASDLDGGGMSDGAEEIAKDILAALAKDVEVEVRKAVAWHLCNSQHLEEEVAETLARDVSDVAVPVLRHSAAVSEQLLIEILSAGDAAKAVAIAGRAALPGAVAEAIVDVGCVEAVVTLLGNAGAVIREPSLGKALDRHGGEPQVAKAMAGRRDLPAAVVVRLIDMVSDEVRRELVERHDVFKGVARAVAQRAGEGVMVRLLAALQTKPMDLRRVVAELQWDRRLTTSLIFRALCAGEERLFMIAMAARAGATEEFVRGLLRDGRRASVEAALARAEVPGIFYEAFRAALGVLRRHGFSVSVAARREYRVEVVAAVCRACASDDDAAVGDLLMQALDGLGQDVVDEAMRRAGMPFSLVRPAP